MPLSRSLIKCIKIFIDISDKPEKEMTYLETGLDEGNSAWDALTNFNLKKIISIEIDKTKIDKVKQRLQYENDYSKIILIEGNSPIQLRKIFDHSIDIVFLDAHGLYTDTDPTKIYPLEKELKFLINKMDEHQLIIIDDFIKIRNNYLFKNRLDWRSHYKYINFKSLLNRKEFKKLEIFYDNGMNSYLLLTKNKKLKINIKLYLINLLLKFLSIRFYPVYYKGIFKKIKNFIRK